MGIELIPSVNKVHDGFLERCNRSEMAVFQALVFEDAEPYLHHVQPGGVEGHEMNYNAFVRGLQPLAAFHPAL